MSEHISLFDIYDWISKLKKIGIKEFGHAELPENLKDRRLLQKANEVGLIKKVRIIKKTGRTVWRIVPKNYDKNLRNKNGRTY